MLVCGPGAGSYECFLARAGAGAPERRLADEDELIGITYARGAAGRTESVLHTHRGAYLNALAEAHHARLDAWSAYLWALPTFHCNGWCFPWAVTAAAAKHVCLPRFEPAAAWRLLSEEDVTHLCATPAALARLASHPSAHVLERPVAATAAPALDGPPTVSEMIALGFELDPPNGRHEPAGAAGAHGWDDPDAEEHGAAASNLRAAAADAA
jgi:fatty-acyl-CoA synthase